MREPVTNYVLTTIGEEGMPSNTFGKGSLVECVRGVGPIAVGQVFIVGSTGMIRLSDGEMFNTHDAGDRYRAIKEVTLRRK